MKNNDIIIHGFKIVGDALMLGIEYGYKVLITMSILIFKAFGYVLRAFYIGFKWMLRL